MLLTEFPVPETGIRHKEDNTKAFIDGNETGDGSLYIAESQVTWLSSAGSGFCLEYPKICLHAISRDPASFPQECLFLQIEGKLIEEDRESNSSSDDGDDDMPTTEVRFVPADKGVLEAMFSALSECQTLHPDPEDLDSDEEQGDGAYYEGVEGVENLTEQGQINLQRMEEMLQLSGQGDNGQNRTNGHVGEGMDDGNEEVGQFDDADMEQ